jgi:hypothetical protein
MLIDPSPNIMILAGQLKDLKYTKNNTKGRQLGTPDAIMLASCVYLRDVLGVDVHHFHTYDNGKSRGIDGGKAFRYWIIMSGARDLPRAVQRLKLSACQG